MQSSTKKKEEVKKLKKSVVKTTKQEKKLTDQEVMLLNLWEQEVSSLLENKFEDFNQAVDAVIDRVVAKIEPFSEKKDASKKFLYEFMSTDPEVIQEIKNIFNLK